MDQIHVLFRATVDDYAEAYRNVFGAPKRFIFGLVFVCGGLWLANSAGAGTLSSFLGGVVFGYGACSIVYYLGIRFNGPRQLFQSHGDHDCEYTFSSRGLEAIGCDGTSQLVWSGFKNATESKRLFLLTRSCGGSIVFVPKRALDANAQSALRALFKECVSA